MTDLSGKTEHAARVKDMLAELRRQQAAHGDTLSLEATNPKPAAWTPPVR